MDEYFIVMVVDPGFSPVNNLAYDLLSSGRPEATVCIYIRWGEPAARVLAPDITNDADA